MGNTLSEPITTKETTSLQNSSVMVASSSMQGWRVSMEDAHQHILELSPEDPEASYYAVFDGHGGAKIAKYASIHLHRIIVNRPEYKTGDFSTAIKEGFLENDRNMKASPDLMNEMAGCTSNVVLIKDGILYCGNAGDSRCIAGVGGTAVALSTDHKPNDPAEKQRITEAGGFVEFNRVNGNLALSRALGDFVFKMNDDLDQAHQIVTCLPDVVERKIEEDWDFLVLACDGIWDVLTNQQVADFVTQRIGKNIQPGQICEELMDRCLAPDCQVGGLGCDNMTVVIVCFLNNKPWSSLVERCSIISSSSTQSSHEAPEIDEDTRSLVATAEDISLGRVPNLEK